MSSKHRKNYRRERAQRAQKITPPTAGFQTLEKSVVILLSGQKCFQCLETADS
jgi:hypothetical protein